MDFESSDSSPIPTDAELFEAMQAQQHSALATLYDRYSSLVYRLALRILLNPQEAEDLTQEIFLKLWRSSTYDVNRGSLSSFLTTLTRSRAIDRLRSRSSTLKSLQRWGTTMTAQPPPMTPFEAASIHQPKFAATAFHNSSQDFFPKRSDCYAASPSNQVGNFERHGSTLESGGKCGNHAGRSRRDRGAARSAKLASGANL